MLSITYKILFLFLISSPLWAFQDNSSLKEPPPRPGGTTEEYFKNFTSNIDKLHQLKAGIFVQESIRDNNGKKEVWYVNDQKDSILLYVMPIGNKHKDGHWLYYHQFLSNMPNQPIFSAIEHIERISRDSFRGTFYQAPKLSWDQLGVLAKQVDVAKLQPTGYTMIYFREDPLHYTAISHEDLTKQSTLLRIRDGKKAAGSLRRDNHFRIRTNMTALRCIFFDEQNKQLYTSDYTIWKRKAATEMPYWVED